MGVHRRIVASSNGMATAEAEVVEPWFVSIDPGLTTGLVIAQVSVRDIVMLHEEPVPWSDRFALHRSLRWLPTKPTAIVIEAFKLFPHAAQNQIGQEFPSVRVIGIVETYAYQLGLLSRLVFQPSSVRGRVQIKHDVMANDHVRDAYRHLRYYLTVNNLV